MNTRVSVVYLHVVAACCPLSLPNVTAMQCECRSETHRQQRLLQAQRFLRAAGRAVQNTQGRRR